MKKPLLQIISFLLFFLFVTAILIFTDSFFRYKHFYSLLNKLQYERFIHLRILGPNQTLEFLPTRKVVMDSFSLTIKPYKATTDSLGFIVSNENHKQAKLNIGFFGGSTAQCLFVEEKQRMSEVVRQQLEKKWLIPVNTWNCAAGGTHGYHTLNLLNNLALTLNLDYAFFYGNMNDVGALIHYGTYNNSNPEKGIFFRIREYDNMHSPKVNGMFPYLKNVLLEVTNQQPERDDFADIRGRAIITDSSILIPQIRKVYKTIIATCRANNIVPVMITQVNVYDRLDYKWLRKNMPYLTISEQDYVYLKKLFHQYNNVIKEVAEQEGAMLIDLDDVDLGFENFYDAIHFNTTGADTVSKIIAARFVEQLRSKKALSH